ncbi:hypothetical protein LTR37_020817 [Vermiconidia calcicola]|uniref:Uncharacterized protein n=1 Tax=Vermiconidia calcicola TaxID=1690605 RepID=A0ACC3MD81_9PEZI|nr:hypothetical protein LTR37_020817 [Vermiconidia calcicola]
MHDPLLTRKLPAELRKHIYRLVLVQLDTIDISLNRTPNEPALLATCSQIHDEALSVYYGENTFLEDIVLSRAQHSWLRSLGIKRAKLITEYRIHLMGSGMSAMSAQEIQERLTSAHARDVFDIFEQAGMKLVEVRRDGAVPLEYVVWE